VGPVTVGARRLTLAAAQINVSKMAARGRRFNVHGLTVELTCGVEALEAELGRVLGEFAADGTSGGAAGFLPTVGVVQPYDAEQVVRHLSPTAKAVRGSGAGEVQEVYQEGERFWVVNERWGLAEINLLRGQWRSWVLPRAGVDAAACVEGAVVWPMAQLLRGKGLHLVPAMSVVRDGWGVLIVCPFGMEGELRALARAGFRVIGRRWTALREGTGGRVEMLRVPGQRAIDEYCGVEAERGWCEAVLVVGPGRRGEGSIEELPAGVGAAVLRNAWPIMELHPVGRPPVMAGRLGRACRVCEARLSREAGEVVEMLTELRETPAKRVTVTVGEGCGARPRGGFVLQNA